MSGEEVFGMGAHYTFAPDSGDFVAPLFSDEERQLALDTPYDLPGTESTMGPMGLVPHRPSVYAALRNEGLESISDLLLVGADRLQELIRTDGPAAVRNELVSVRIGQSLAEFNRAFVLRDSPGPDYAAHLCEGAGQVPAQALPAYPLGENQGQRVTVKNVLDVSFGDKLELPDFRRVWEQALWYAAGFRVAKDRLA